jgi:hypothetical protein
MKRVRKFLIPRALGDVRCARECVSQRKDKIYCEASTPHRPFISRAEMRPLPHPLTKMHEYQNEGLIGRAFHKLLITKELFAGVCV